MFYFTWNAAGQTYTTKDTLKHLFLAEQEFIVDVISKYYPFTQNEIDKYTEFINFRYISQNQEIDWTYEFLETNKEDLFLYEVCRNSSFPWNQNSLIRYQDEDWFNLRYIVGNRKIYIDKSEFGNLKISEDTIFIQPSDIKEKILLYNEYPKRNRSDQDTLDYFLKEADLTWKSRDTIMFLNSIKNKNISTFDIDFFKKYSKYIDWYKLVYSEQLNWNLNLIVDLVDKLNLSHLFHQETHLKKIFAEHLDSSFISETFNSLSERRENILLPIKSYNEKDYTSKASYKENTFKKFSTEFINENIFPDSLKDIDFIIGDIYSIPLEYHDYHEFNSHNSSFPIRLVSSRLKEIFNQFELPKHKYYKVNLHNESHWYGDEIRPYYLLVLERADKLNFDFKNVLLKSRSNIFEQPQNISNQLIDSLEQKERWWFTPKRFLRDKLYTYQVPIKNALDVFYVNNTLHMSKRLLSCIEENNITGLYKELFRYPEFVLPDLPKSKIVCTKQNLTKELQNNILYFQSLKDSIKTLVNSAYSFNEYIKENKIEGISDLEKKLEVIFPEKFKEYLEKNKFYLMPNIRDEGYTEYDYYDKKKITKIHSSWVSIFPMIHNGITIANNGLGDYLALILEKNHPFQLSSMVYKLEHDIGELKPFKEIK